MLYDWCIVTVQSGVENAPGSVERMIVSRAGCGRGPPERSPRQRNQRWPVARGCLPPRSVAKKQTYRGGKDVRVTSQPLTVLHVEDNPDHAKLIGRSLVRFRVAEKVHLIEDGEAALDYLFRRNEYQDSQSSPRPDLILLDLRLPKVDGLEVLCQIKTSQELLHIPVVVLTSSETEKDVAEAYRYHANSYLVKPVGFDQFSDMIQRLGTYWQAWNRYPKSSAVC